MRKTFAAGILLTAALLYSSCGKDSGSSKVALKGSLSATDYSTAQNFGVFDRLWAAVVQGIAYAAGTTVNEIWALPLYNGEFHPTAFDSVTKATPSGGNVDVELTQGKSWSVLLLDTAQAAKKNQVVGFLSMSAGDHRVTSLPMGGEAVDLGTVTKKGDETESSRGHSDNASVLSLSVDALAKLGAIDDSIKTVKNAYRNYSGTTFLSVKPFYVWRWSSATSAISNTFSSPSTLVTSKFFGYLFYMNSNHSGINYSAICNQSALMTLTPPSTVANVSGGASFTTSSPITSAGTNSGTSGNSCGPGNLYIRDDTATYGSYQFNFSASSGGSNEYLAPPIPAGDWTLKVGSTTIGEFEGNIGSIFRDDDTTKPIVFIPSLKVNLSGSTISSIEVKWYLRNESTGAFDEVTDSTLLSNMQSAVISMTDYSASPRREERSSSLSPGGYSYSPTGSWGLTSNVSIDVDYTINNVAIHVEFRI